MNKQPTSPQYVDDAETVPQAKKDIEEHKSDDELESKTSGTKTPEVIRYHPGFDGFEADGPEVITIYCRTRKTMKKAAGGTTTAAATVGTCALIMGTTVVTGGLATPWIAAGSIGVVGTSYVAGGAITGYLVNPRVMRFDFTNYDEANEAFRQISTYKVMIRDGKVAQSMGKMRWVAELVGSAITDESENGPGLLLSSVPEPEQRFNILRSPMTYGASKTRWRPWQSFSIKQYTTDYQESAEEKWKKISYMNSAILLCGSGIEKTHGKKAYVNELIGWYVLGQTLPAESKNHIKIDELDDL